MPEAGATVQRGYSSVTIRHASTDQAVRSSFFGGEGGAGGVSSAGGSAGAITGHTTTRSLLPSGL
jgi:hypothetical protein